MHRFLKATIFVVLVGITVGPVSAHPGGTASDGCHYCYTNCAKWGVPYGVRHCHNNQKKDDFPETEISSYPQFIDGDDIRIEKANELAHECVKRDYKNC